MPIHHLGGDNLATWGKLAWAPPPLVNPRTITLTNTATGRQTRDPANVSPVDADNSNNAPFMNPNIDYIVKCAEVIRQPNGIEFNGGRNVFSKALEVAFASDFGTTNSNRALFIKGNSAQTAARTVHIEGFKASGILREGINIDSQCFDGGEPGLTVQLQNIEMIDVLLGTQATNHSDFVQAYNGPYQLRMDRCYARPGYQGLMIQPHQFGASPLGTYQFKRMYLDGTDDSGTMLYMVTGSAADRPAVVTDRVFLRPSPLKAFPSQVMLESPAFWGNGVVFAPHGRRSSFVSSQPGIYYVSPGYSS